MREFLTMDELLDLAAELREATENVHGVDPRHFEEAARCLRRYASLKSWRGGRQ